MSSKFVKKIKRVAPALLIAGVALLISSCGNPGEKVTDLNVSEFAKEISDSSVVVLDVRTPGEFQEGHIKNSINIDFENSSFESQIKSLDKNKTYAVYCRSGRRSGLATKMMAQDGFTSLFNLTGGIIEWQSAGNEITHS